MTETLEWFTDVLGSRTGEQRIALRSVPRQFFELSHIFEAADYAFARHWTRRNGAIEVLVPVWPEGQQIDTTVASGSTVLTLDTTIMDVRDGAYFAVWEDEFTYHTSLVTSHTTTTVTLTTPTTADLVRPHFLPVRRMFLTGGAKFTRSTTVTTATLAFQAVDNVDLSPAAPLYLEFGGYEIMTTRPVLQEDISNNIVRAAEYVDNGFGPVVVESVRDYADYGQTLGFHDRMGAEMWTRRQWLHGIKGRQRAFWMPAFSSELLPTADIDAADVTITVTSVAPTSYYANQSILFQMSDGTFIAKTITGAVVADARHDTLTLNSALGVDVALADLVMICFLALSRLDSDSVTITYDPERGSLSILVIEVPA